MVKQTMYLFLAILMLQTMFLTGMGYGFNAADLQKVNSTNKCEKCDLSNADFSGIDMYGAQLIGANLTGANIKGTNFSGAKLSNTIWIDGRKCQSGSMSKCK